MDHLLGVFVILRRFPIRDLVEAEYFHTASFPLSRWDSRTVSDAGEGHPCMSWPDDRSPSYHLLPFLAWGCVWTKHVRTIDESPGKRALTRRHPVYHDNARGRMAGGISLSLLLLSRIVILFTHLFLSPGSNKDLVNPSFDCLCLCCISELYSVHGFSISVQVFCISELF